MGTGFYARIIPKEDEKNELINKIINNKFDEIEDLASELYGNRNEYTRKGNVIHLGKRSCGWKFLWNPNIIRYCDGYIDTETKEFIMPAYDITVSAEFDKVIENKEVIEKENPSENENKIENPKTIDKINTYIIISR